MLSVTYKGKSTPPPVGLIISEGKRTHHFRINYLENYNINKDPSLYYDYSDIKVLRKYVESLKNDKAQSNLIAQAEADKEAFAKKEEEIAAQRAAEEVKRKQEEEALAKKRLAEEEELKKKLKAQELEKKQKELVGLLKDSIQDQSAFFSRIGNNDITISLKEIQRIINRLEDRVHISKKLRTNYHYLLLNAFKKENIVHVSYWVTDPNAAQFLKSNVRFEADRHSETISSETFSLTSALGGLESPNEISKNNALAIHLSSGGKIVSEDDLKRLCMIIFSEKLKSVNIKKVSKPMKGLKNGINRFVEINIQLYPEKTNPEFTEYLKLRLEHALKENASIALPFQINIL